jgi:hypothetical protein
MLLLRICLTIRLYLYRASLRKTQAYQYLRKYCPGIYSELRRIKEVETRKKY